VSGAALDLLLSLRLEDGRRWGEAAEPWQRSDAEALLDETGPRLHYQTRPRGGSKTTDASACSACALVAQLPPRSRSYAAAADAGQAALLLDALGGFVARTDGLAGALRVDASKVTSTRSGATLEVLAADEASSWGLRPHLLVVDEFAAWPTTRGPRRFWTSLFSALPKVPGSRLLILTTAGEPSHPAYKLLERARASGAWRVSEVPGPTPWLDPADLDEQRAELPAWEFERLHLNRWVESDDRLSNVADLAACVTLDGPRERAPGRRYALGLDVGLRHDRTALVVCSVEQGRSGVALDRLAVWQGSRARPVSLDTVEAAIVEAWSSYGRPPLVADPWQSAQLCQRLRARGVRVVEFTFSASSVSRLALRLHGLIREHALALPDDPELIDELASVRLRETSPGSYRLDHEHGAHDDRAIALALAADHLLARPGPSGPWTSHVPRGAWIDRAGLLPGTSLYAPGGALRVDDRRVRAA
jgi:phage terminase large subunit-like protein